MSVLSEVPFSYVEPFAASAAKEGVCLRETARQTLWFRSAAHEGFCGLIEYGAGKWRIKGVFVQREYRGEGIGTSMTEALIAHAIDTLKAERLEVIALNPEFYEARNFQRADEVRPGSWRLVYVAEPSIPPE